MAIVQELYVYPVKSARALPRARARVGASGLEWDRHWMVVNAGGTFLSQRTHPRLALLTPEIREEQLVLEAPGLPALTLPLEPAGEPLTVRVWKDLCTGLDAGEPASEWLGRLLDETVRLVRVAPSMHRVADRRYTGELTAPLAFPDGFPILVCNQASLEEINARMTQRVPMERFRPNLVLAGLPAFAEDRIDTLHIGELTLRLVKPCVRCVIPSIDQRTGEPGSNPTPVLRELRFNAVLRGVTFGENAVVHSGAGLTVERGAECEVRFQAAPR